MGTVDSSYMMLWIMCLTPRRSQYFARREMSMALATIINRYDLYQGQEGPTLELYDTIRERDIAANSEMIIPMPAKGSKGLRIKIRH